MLSNIVQLMHQGCAPGRSVCNGKGNTAPAPDYTPMAAASKEAAETGAQLGREQLAENRRQYDQNMAVADPIIKAQTAQMNANTAQGEDYYNYSKNTFRPLEQSLADEAQSGQSRYTTNAGVRANIEQEATRASADAARAQANSTAQNQRMMASMGINPNSGRFAAMNRGQGLANAAMRAGAQTNSRVQGVQLDKANRLDAAGLGRNLAGASTGAYGLALNAGNAAVGNQNSTSAQYMNGMNAGNSTIMQGQGLQMQGLGSALNAQTSLYGMGLQANAANSAGLGQAAGLGLGAYAALSSDRRLKENIVEAGEYPNGMKMYEFNYTGNDKRFRGVMAQDIEHEYPEAIHYDDCGFMSVDYAMLGIEMTEV